jgi:hypothetical protein
MNLAKSPRQIRAFRPQIALGGILLFISISTISLSLWSIVSDQPKYFGTMLEITGATNPLPEIVENVEVRQTFLATHGGVSQITFLIGTFARSNESTLLVQLKDSKNRTLRYNTFSMSQFPDNSFLTFNFKPILNSIDKSYSLAISSRSAVSGNAITVWSTSEDSYSFGELSINNTPLEADLVMKISYLSRRR